METERRIKLSGVLKLFSVTISANRPDSLNFFETFSDSPLQDDTTIDLDRGGLKWPSVPVLEAVCTLWNLYMKIEKDSNLFAQFLKAPSRRILVTLAMLIIESQEVEFWRNKHLFIKRYIWLGISQDNNTYSATSISGVSINGEPL